MKSNTLLAKDMILRNACTICDLGDRFLNAYLDDFTGRQGQFRRGIAPTTAIRNC